MTNKQPFATIHRTSSDFARLLFLFAENICIDRSSIASPATFFWSFYILPARLSSFESVSYYLSYFYLLPVFLIFGIPAVRLKPNQAFAAIAFVLDTFASR